MRATGSSTARAEPLTAAAGRRFQARPLTTGWTLHSPLAAGAGPAGRPDLAALDGRSASEVVEEVGEQGAGSVEGCELTEALLSYGSVTRPRTVVDLSGVTFMDSSGINVLVAAHQSMSDAQGWLLIAGPQSLGAAGPGARGPGPGHRLPFHCRTGPGPLTHAVPGHGALPGFGVRGIPLA